MKSSSPRVKRTVEQTIEYFGLTAYSISAQKTHVTLQNKEVDSSLPSVPTTIYLSFSDKDDRLTQLTAAWSKSPKDQPPNLEAARSTAADFVELVLAEKFASAERGTLWSSSKMAIFPVYPVVNEIPVQKSVGEIFVDSSGHVSSYQLRDADFKENNLPSKAGILSREQAIHQFSSQLQLELTYDDENGRYAYAALPYSAIDAKTGKALEASADFTDTHITIDKQSTKQSITTPVAAKELAATFFGLKSDQLSTSASRESHPNEPPISIYTVENDRQTLEIRVSEQTSELLSVQLSAYRADDDSDALVDLSEARGQALTFMKRYIPLAPGDYILRAYPQSSEKATSPARAWMELYASANGVRSSKPLVVITMDLHGNVLNSATARTYAPSSAAIPGVLSLEEAKQNWMRALPVGLAYVYPSDLDPEKDSPVLAYVPSFSAADRYVNALTGEVDSWK
ncbi:hypothetical protein [Brevibacillus centrosporus]|uniref:hypothetical protein n=1 Tax=Brevibacillus centrosporus TaxID=54910 RepID=UPI003988785A